VVSSAVAMNGKGEAEVLRLAAALERRSEHPLAHAILTAAGGAELPPVSGFRSVAGRGAEGEVDGKRYLIGSPRLFAERGIDLGGAGEALERSNGRGRPPSSWATMTARWRSSGSRTPCARTRRPPSRPCAPRGWGSW
jgi:cation transport ATPase